MPPLVAWWLKVNACASPEVVAMLVKTTRSGTDMPSKYFDLLAFRIELIQTQSPKVGFWLAHCLKSTTRGASSKVVLATGVSARLPDQGDGYTRTS